MPCEFYVIWLSLCGTYPKFKNLGIPPSAHGGAVLRGCGRLAVLAGVHHDHQVPREVPAGHPPWRRLGQVPELGEQIYLEEGNYSTAIPGIERPQNATKFSPQFVPYDLLASQTETLSIHDKAWQSFLEIYRSGVRFFVIE